MIAAPEGIPQFEIFKRRTRAAFYGGGVFVILLNLAVVSYIFYNHPLRAHNQEALPWYVGGFIVTAAIVVAFIVLLRQAVARNTPRCPRCAAKATWRELSQVLSSGCCPRCASRYT